jgi:hypothetical protein
MAPIEIVSVTKTDRITVIEAQSYKTLITVYRTEAQARQTRLPRSLPIKTGVLLFRRSARVTFHPPAAISLSINASLPPDFSLDFR